MSISIATPKAHLIGAIATRPEGLESLDAEMTALLGEPVDLSSDAPSCAEELVELAGRACYLSFHKRRPGGNKAYIEHILEVGHGSVLEHAVYTIALTGVSRSFSHEMVRHRHISPSQLSQRFVDQSAVRFVVPPAIEDIPVAQAAWIAACERALDHYGELALYLEAAFAATPDKTLRRKRAREAARSVLPNCVETVIVLTGNARAWRNFIEQRASVHADLEIQRVAGLVLDLLREASPNIFGDYRDDPDGGVTTDHRKV